MGKRILLTGGSGFLGDQVRQRLESAGAADVFVPRRSEYDLTDAAAVARAYEAARPDTVVHLAAEVGGIGANRDNPGRRHDVEKVVGVGTVCSYPKHTPVPFTEDELWNGYPEETNAPYGIAKKALLVMLQGYRAQYGLGSAYLMPVNLYGPGTGQVSREFLYVDDCAEAIVLAAQRHDGPEPINIGAASEITIRELTELIARLTGFEGELTWDPSKPDGQPRRSLDTSRARELLGFTASTPLEEGLQRTIAWFRQHAPSPV